MQNTPVGVEEPLTNIESCTLACYESTQEPNSRWPRSLFRSKAEAVSWSVHSTGVASASVHVGYFASTRFGGLVQCSCCSPCKPCSDCRMECLLSCYPAHCTYRWRLGDNAGIWICTCQRQLWRQVRLCTPSGTQSTGCLPSFCLDTT